MVYRRSLAKNLPDRQDCDAGASARYCLVFPIAPRTRTKSPQRRRSKPPVLFARFFEGAAWLLPGVLTSPVLVSSAAPSKNRVQASRRVSTRRSVARAPRWQPGFRRRFVDRGSISDRAEACPTKPVLSASSHRPRNSHRCEFPALNTRADTSARPPTPRNLPHRTEM